MVAVNALVHFLLDQIDIFGQNLQVLRIFGFQLPEVDRRERNNKRANGALEIGVFGEELLQTRVVEKVPAVELPGLGDFGQTNHAVHRVAGGGVWVRVQVDEGEDIDEPALVPFDVEFEEIVEDCDEDADHEVHEQLHDHSDEKLEEDVAEMFHFGGAESEHERVVPDVLFFEEFKDAEVDDEPENELFLDERGRTKYLNDLRKSKQILRRMPGLVFDFKWHSMFDIQLLAEPATKSFRKLKQTLKRICRLDSTWVRRQHSLVRIRSSDHTMWHRFADNKRQIRSEEGDWPDRFLTVVRSLDFMIWRSE